MKNKYLLILVIFASAAFLVFMREWKQTSDNPAQTSQSSMAPISALETQTNSEGPVTVKATPKISSEIVFEIILDTHSVELNEDLTSFSVLVDDDGREYKPIFWEGDPPGGHHREGILKFNLVEPRSKIIKLIIRQIGGISERTFLWIP